ncbi:hypothetical protein M5K25_007663 [Dendrobium thyrsiflorum]|uniref:CCHC-type domain-containing protein n=1 Tax=Dendrobium thyrsiflorum TaxID=117978 RepID=A0ABD0VM41_DENTH
MLDLSRIIVYSVMPINPYGRSQIGSPWDGLPKLKCKWNPFGVFRLTSLGLDWFLCSFQYLKFMDAVLSGGPWYVGRYIIGMDRWSPSCSLTSLKGLSSPVWIHLPLLPLQFWDEFNILRIASRIGMLLLIDDQMLNWVDGSHGRFFQRVEYEKISNFCFHCGKFDHVQNNCNNKQSVDVNNVTKNCFEECSNPKNIISDYGPQRDPNSYGSWIHVNYGRNKIQAGRQARSTRNNRFLRKHALVKDNSNQVGHDVNHQKSNVQVSTKGADGKHVDEVSSDVVDVNAGDEEVSNFNGMNDVPITKIVLNLNRGNNSVMNIQNSFYPLINSKLNVNDEKEDHVSLNIQNSVKYDRFNRELISLSTNDGGKLLSKTRLHNELRRLGHVEGIPRKKERGAKKREASLYLREFVKKYDFFFIGILETKLTSIDRSEVKELLEMLGIFFISHKLEVHVTPNVWGLGDIHYLWA